MPLENAGTINELVSSNPVAGVDQGLSGDDHIRLLKNVLKDTFRNQNGPFLRTVNRTAAFALVATDQSTINVLTAAAGYAVTFPTVGTMGNGFFCFLESLANAGVDITFTTSAPTFFNTAGVTSLTLKPGQTAFVTSSDGDGWNVVIIPSLTNPNTWSAAQTFSVGTDITNVVNRNTTEVVVVNTAAETTVYSYTVLAGALSTNKVLRLNAALDFKNDGVGGSPQLTLRVKYGGTTIATIIFALNSTGVNRWGISLSTEMFEMNTASAQRCYTSCLVGQSPADGASSGGASIFGNAHVSSIVNSAIDQALVITAQISIANASLEVKRYSAVTEIY